MISRRSLLTCAAGLGIATIGAGLPLRIASAQAASGRVLVHVMLPGGADLRQLFAPDPTIQADYAAAFWKARAAMTNQNTNLATYQTVYNSQYTRLTLSSQTFGVHNAAGWLISMLRAGKAAIVANVAGSDNRQHESSQLIWRTGDSSVSPFDYDRDGWGGRLVYALNKANAASVSTAPTVFTQGLEAGRRNARAIHIPQPRKFALDEVTDSIVGRALTSYYQGKQVDAGAKPATWPFHRILQHEASLRALGQALNARLAGVAPLSMQLYNTDFARQCAALFDCAVASDILQMRVGYMEHGGWDTHLNQVYQLERNISDVFGSGKGLATLYGGLEKIKVSNNYVFVITSEFGRQLAANSRGGTEHGRGSYTIIIGDGVRGAAFGELFPASEIARFGALGSDIVGLTSFERVLGEICDWVAAGSGNVVFPGRAASPLEAGVELKAMFG